MPMIDLAYYAAKDIHRRGPMLCHIVDLMRPATERGEPAGDVFARVLNEYFLADDGTMTGRLTNCLRPLLEIRIRDEAIDGRILMAGFYFFALSLVVPPMESDDLGLLADLAQAFVCKYDDVMQQLVATKRVSQVSSDELLEVAVTFYREMQCWLSENNALLFSY
jgi:hypothetical protein